MPFVVGVIADFAGQPEVPLPIFAERRFLPMDSAGFHPTMAAIRPRLVFEAEDNFGCLITLDLSFPALSDFEPAQISKQLEGRLALPQELLARQVENVFEILEFRRMRARWQGLYHLMSGLDSGAPIQFEILSAKPKEIYRDLVRAAKCEQSALFRKVHDAVYGEVERAPFSLLISDFEFGPGPDIEVLSRIAGVAAIAHCPFLAVANEDGFDIGAMALIEQMRYPEKLHASAEYARWNLFRKSADANFVALVMQNHYPRFPNSIVDLWRFSRRVVASFGNSRCFAGIDHGVEKSVRRLARLGFIHFDRPDILPSTVHEPEVASADEGLTSGRSTQLAYVLAISRLAQYLKVMVRDRSSQFELPPDCEQYLRECLARYTDKPDSPFTSAHVQVVRGQEPGIYYADLRAVPGGGLPDLIWALRALILLEPGKLGRSLPDRR